MADHPVRFFSALSLEKNAPSVGLSGVLGTSAVSLTKTNGSSDRRNGVGDKRRADDDMAGLSVSTAALFAKINWNLIPITSITSVRL